MHWIKQWIRCHSTRWVPIDFLSLTKYKKLHGHLMVPQSFSFDVCPQTKTEEDLQQGFAAGYLGMHVKEIRMLRNKNSGSLADKDRDRLAEIGFVWSANLKKFELTLQGLVRYRELFGDVSIPIKYTVPVDDINWSRELWGLKLGHRYRDIIGRKENEKKRALLNTLDISCDKLRHRSGCRVELAVQTYKFLYHHADNDSEQHKILRIPRQFVVPSADPQWPMELWGMKLGHRVNNAKNNNRFRAFHDKFRELGIDIAVTDDDP